MKTISPHSPHLAIPCPAALLGTWMTRSGSSLLVSLAGCWMWYMSRKMEYDCYESKIYWICTNGLELKCSVMKLLADCSVRVQTVRWHWWLGTNGRHIIVNLLTTPSLALTQTSANLTIGTCANIRYMTCLTHSFIYNEAYEKIHFGGDSSSCQSV